MEMINKAFADADAFKKMMESIERPAAVGNRGPGTPQNTGHVSRQQRRARERAETKARSKAAADGN